MHPLRQVFLTASALLLATAPGLRAQHYNFKFYGEDEGLENLVVQAVTTDREGFLWAGTQNGLFRYDGSQFIRFGKADGLPGSRIESLHQSVDGTLWVGTRTGLARRDGRRFEAVPLGVARGILGREGIASDASGRLYLATERGLVLASKAGRKWKFQLVAAPPSHPPAEEADSVYVDSKETVWFGCGAAGLCRLERDAQGSERAVDAGAGLSPDRWEAIIEDLDGNLWVRSEHVLAFHSPTSRRFQVRGGLPPSTNTNPVLALDPEGKLLVATRRGLARETSYGWEIVGAEQGLSTNDISAVQQDREGSIWLGLLGSGLARWLGYNEWQGWNEQDGLSNGSIWSLARDKAGRLWVGTQFGLNYAEQKDGRLLWRHMPVPGLEVVRALAAAPDGTLWIGGEPGGLRQWNPASDAMRSFGASDGLESDSVRSLAVDRNGTVWVATGRGLFRTGPAGMGAGARRTLHFERVSLPGTQPTEGFSMVLADRDGRIWVCGDLGLARYGGGQWTRFTVRDGLKDDMVAQVAEDRDGSIWIGYRDAYGLTHLTFPSGKPSVKHFTTANGLRSDKSVSLGIDARGMLWVGTDHGIDVYDGAQWGHYGRADGLIWDDCNGNALLADSGGVWIGTSRGLSRFQARSSPVPAVPPPVVFTSVKLGGKEVDAAAAGTWEVPYGGNSIEVRFSALSYVQESNVLFRYRLINVERNWLETPQHELNYPKLPPGTYTLEVMARSGRGVWSSEPARLSFQVLTPWWLTWWFRIGSVMLTLLAGRMLWQRRTYRLEAERARLEGAVAERTHELELEKQRVVNEKARTEQENTVVQRQKQEIERLLAEARQASHFKSEFLANVSHEIRTPMNGILGMTDLVLSTPLTPEQRDYLETARLSADSLLAILNDILDFSKIEAGKLDLNPICFPLHECVRQTVKIFALEAAEKRIGLSAEVAPAVPERVVGDPDRLQQVLINLIGNALKFTPRGGRVCVKLQHRTLSHGTLEALFTVEDTGIGIPADKQQLIFESFRQADGSTTRRFGGTGLGLAICSKLVDLMGGRIWVKSEPGRGSEFFFTARFELAPDERPLETAAPGIRHLRKAVDESNSKGLRILLAEDNVVNQRLQIRLLERFGHQVTLATTGREVLAQLNREPSGFDLILMDVQMPDMDGLEATEAIRFRERTTGGHIPILALTAHTMKGDRERCLAAGMDAFITKPINAGEFLKAVETAGGHYEPVRGSAPEDAAY